MTETDNIKHEQMTLAASDGYELAATYFHADSPMIGRLIVAGATGVPRKFYTRFAKFSAKRGFSTLPLDYRGIGESKPDTLKGFDMNFLDWASLDLAAAVDFMADENIPLFMVGHSFGGHALGSLHNHHQIKGAYFFATGAGWNGWMPRLESLKVSIMWNIIYPALTRWKGYAPFSLLGMGEDLPLGVYEQWRRWCKFPHYFFDDPEMSHIESLYATVKTPIISAVALDDYWAPPKSRDAFLKGYKNAPVTRLDIDPQPFQGGIGHMGYFRKTAEPLWEEILGWFNQLVTNN